MAKNFWNLKNWNLFFLGATNQKKLSSVMSFLPFLLVIYTIFKYKMASIQMKWLLSTTSFALFPNRNSISSRRK